MEGRGIDLQHRADVLKASYCRSNWFSWVTQLKFLLFGNSKRTRAPIFLHSRRNDGRQNTGLNWDIPFMCYGESIFTPYIENWHSWFRWGHGWKRIYKEEHTFRRCWTFPLALKPPAQFSGSVTFLVRIRISDSKVGSFSFRQCTSKKRLKVIKNHKTVKIKVFLTIFAWWLKDPEPGQYLWLTDPEHCSRGI